jgi:AcrR family transcriptional regulator
MPKIVDHDERRRDIALAACRAIAHHGIDAVTLADIAREAGYTTGMISHYYASKWEVMLAGLRSMNDRLGRKLLDAASESRSLADLLCEVLPTDAEHRAESRAWLSFWAVSASQPQLVRWSAKTHTDWRALIRHCVISCTPQSTSWPSQVMEDVISSIILFMDGIYVKGLTRSSDYSPKDQIRLLRAHLDALMCWASNHDATEPPHGPAKR